MYRSSNSVSPSMRQHLKRLQPGSHGSQKSKAFEPSHQAPRTPPSKQRKRILKRRRASSLQDSTPSKAPRQSGQDCITYDSEGFEMVEPVDLPTPSTVEIFNTSDTERAPTPDAAEKADAEEPYGSNDTQTSNSSGHCTADTFRSLESLEAQKHPAGHPTPGRCVSPCGKHNICPHCCSNTLLKPDLLDDANPDLSPNTYIDVRNLGLHSPDGSFPELWANYPVSFIPFTSPLGPRDLEPSHYNCPYPGCIDPFGPCGHPDGYNGKELALHIYRHHGYGPAVERVRLDLHKRVMIVRRAQGKNGKDAPLPCCWIDSIRDLEQTTVGLVQDLEEIRQWERSLRAAISGKGEPASVTQAACNDRPALVEEKESVRAAEKDKGERRR